MSKYPYSQAEHDEAVGIGCLLLLAVLSPFVVMAVAVLGTAMQSLLSALLTALVAVQ